MAEAAFGVRTPPLCFIGLVGQALQGCEYIRAVLDDVQDAPADLRSLYTEIKLFELTMQNFRDFLFYLKDSGITVTGDEEKAVQSALKYSKDTIARLAKNRSWTRDRWKWIRFAIVKHRWLKSVAEVERAKGCVVTAQAGILLYFEHQRHIITRGTDHKLGSLTSILDTSSSTISIQSCRFDEVSLGIRNKQKL